VGADNSQGGTYGAQVVKINLECGPDVRNGYINTDSIANKDPTVKTCLMDNLDDICPNDFADEIIAGFALNMIPWTRVDKVLKHWHAKLKNDGLLKITFPEIRQVGRLIYTGQLNSPDDIAKYLIVLKNKKVLSLFDANQLSERLLANGLSIQILQTDRNGIGAIWARK
jgi:predicted SAM-dependent methyltransferase